MSRPAWPLPANPEEAYEFLNELRGKLDYAATGHRTWYTHKRDNGMYCWICDYDLALARALDLVKQLLENDKGK